MKLTHKTAANIRYGQNVGFLYSILMASDSIHKTLRILRHQESVFSLSMLYNVFRKVPLHTMSNSKLK